MYNPVKSGGGLRVTGHNAKGATFRQRLRTILSSFVYWAEPVRLIVNSISSASSTSFMKCFHDTPYF